MSKAAIIALGLAAGVFLGGPAARAQDASEGLPPQTLHPGDCGVFFWSRSGANTFLAFVNRTRGEARLWQDGRIIEFTIPATAEPEGRLGELLSWDIPQAGARLEGEITERRGEEYVLARAFLRRTLADDAQAVVPLVGLAACRGTSAP